MTFRRFVFAILLVGFLRITNAQTSGKQTDVDKGFDSILSEIRKAWGADPGGFSILVGSSSDKIELQGTFVLAP